MSNERRLIIALFALALGLRVLYAAVGTQLEIPRDAMTVDLAYAERIAGGLEWVATPVSPRAPGYPIVLGILYLISGGQLWIVTFLQAVLGALTVVALYLFGREILGRMLAMIAAVWFAFHVQHMHFTALFHRDVLVVLLFVVLLYLVTRPFNRMAYGLAAGIVFAALAHVDPLYVLLLPLFAVFILFFKTKHPILNIQYFFVFAVAIVVFATPWTVRNYFVYGQAMPVSIEASRYLLPTKILGPDRDIAVSHLERRATEAARTRRLQTNSVEFWRVVSINDRTVEARDGSDDRVTIAAWSLRHNLASIINYGILLPFAVVGLYFAVRRRERTVLMLAATIAAYFVTHAYFGGSERARLPVDPLLTLVAFYGVLAISTRRTNEPDAVTSDT